MSDTIDVLVEFGRTLRAEGVRVGTSELLDFCVAVDLLGPRDLYWAGRTSLVSRQADLATYDRVFRAFFRDPSADIPDGAPELPTEGGDPRPSPGDIRLGPTRRGSAATSALASTFESERERSFADWSPDELARLGALLRRQAMRLPPRRSRRRAPARTGLPDLRRTLRSSLRTGGDPLHVARRARQDQPRRLVLLLDVSRSMSPYSRALLLFAYSAVRRSRRGEAFCFGTRLTRITRLLDQRRPQDVLDRAAAEVLDWDGGTRIGQAIKSFLDEYGHRGMARGAVIVIASDGLDAGEPELLERQMARLGRLAHQVIWLNPLAASDRYKPLARGMQAALSHLDLFLSGHSLASLEAMEDQLVALAQPGLKPSVRLRNST
jgi:uncharacterized protein with von Willebrand factor type A (vWA) domain